MEDASLIHKLHNIGAIKFGSFTLKSGIRSPIYIDLRLIISYPSLLKEISEKLWEMIRETSFDLICGVPYTALPIATSISLSHNLPMVMRRKEVKEYGTRKTIEGFFTEGSNCLVVEDLVTSGRSVLETIAPLEASKIRVEDIIVLIDRQQGGRELLEEKGYRLHSLITMKTILEILKKDQKLTTEKYEEILSFLAANNFSGAAHVC